MDRLKSLAPGLLLCFGLAAAAVFLAGLPWVKESLRWSALLIVILLGMAVATAFKLPNSFKPGLALAQRDILRWAVAGLGLQLSWQELQKAGVPGLVIAVVCVAASLAFGWWLAVRLGMEEKSAILLSVGTSVCGASAIVAANSVVQAEDRDAAMNLGVITLWGTVGILIYPLLAPLLNLDAAAFGIWSGASLQEMAQSVAAGAALGDESKTIATVVKLCRILMLAPVVFFLTWWLKKYGRAAGEAKVDAVPWFLVLFAVFAVLASLWQPIFNFPQSLLDREAKTFVQFLMAAGMAGVGLKTSAGDLIKAGWRPVLAGALQWLFIAILALVLIKAMLPA